jgi:membrane protein YqaA with SNARE-associated domain
MKALLTWIYNLATAIGGPGLFLIAFLDSSFLSFPQANDLLIVLMVAANPSWMAYYATLATLGSLTGCLALYHVARKGGEAFLRRRVSEGRVQWGFRLFERYGVLAILVPSLLPPPAPFKLFVLLAGAARMPVWTFAASILVGRGARYFGIGLLTVWYGEQAMDYLQQHGRMVARIVALTVLGLVLLYFGIRRWRGRTKTGSDPVFPDRPRL